jgi:hypothetical protein
MVVLFEAAAEHCKGRAAPVRHDNNKSALLYG